MTQLWICDWLLEKRTIMWQENAANRNLPFSPMLYAFQRDLLCLKHLYQRIPVRIETNCNNLLLSLGGKLSYFYFEF